MRQCPGELPNKVTCFDPECADGCSMQRAEEAEAQNHRVAYRTESGAAVIRKKGSG